MDQRKLLPRDWVDRIFMRLQGVYGREFTAHFSVIDQASGIDVGMENAKQVWAEELASFADWPEAIRYALKNLPERVPNVIRFREICRHAPPRNGTPQLVHKLTNEELERNKERIKQIREMFLSTYTGPKQ